MSAEEAVIQRAAIAIMESPEWHSSGDLKKAKRVARIALEAVAPIADIAALFEDNERRKNLRDFDQIWPIA